jgi:hypothetical protein
VVNAGSHGGAVDIATKEVLDCGGEGDLGLASDHAILSVCAARWVFPSVVDVIVRCLERTESSLGERNEKLPVPCPLIILRLPTNDEKKRLSLAGQRAHFQSRHLSFAARVHSSLSKIDATAFS